MARGARLAGLVAAPRSGTHFLHGLLQDHPDVRFHSEVFSGLGRHRDRWVAGDPTAYLLQWSAEKKGERVLSDPQLFRPIRVLEYLRDVRRFAGAQLVGIDLKYWTWASLPPQSMAVVEHEVEVWIHLIRRDLLRGVVSDVLRAASHLTPADEDEGPAVLHEADRIGAGVLQRAREIAAFRARLRGRPHVELVYEDLFDDPSIGSASIRPDEQARLLQALGLRPPGRLLVSPRRKVNPPDMRTRVRNYDALVEHVRAHVQPRLRAEGLPLQPGL